MQVDTSYPGDVYLYDLQSKTTKPIYRNRQDAEQFRPDQWSPNGRYVRLVSDNEVALYSLLIIDTATGKTVTNLLVHDSYYWLSKDKILYNQSNPTIKPLRPTSTANATSIALFYLKTGQEKIIKQATAAEDYFCSVQDDKIILTKYEYMIEKEGTKSYLSGVKSVKHYVMAENGTILGETADPYSSAKEKDLLFQNSIRKMLPLPYRNYNNIDAVPIIQDWVMITVHNGSRNEFFLMKQNTPTSLKKIGEGSFISW